MQVPIVALGIEYSLKCTNRCGHCAVEAGPERKEKLTPEDIIPRVAEFHARGIREIVFAGGEPVLFIDELEEISKEIKIRGWKQTIFTNSYWADTLKNARLFSLRFKKMQVDQMVISTSQYHREFTRAENILNAVRGLKEEGIEVGVMLMVKPDNGGNDHILMELRRLNVSSSLYRLYPQGRGGALKEKVFCYHLTWPQVIRSRCGLLHQMFISSAGDVLRCCTITSFLNALGTKEFYHYGNIREDNMTRIFDNVSRYNRVFQVMRHCGVGEIYEHLREKLEKAGFIPDRLYSSPCEFCSSLFGNKRYLKIVTEHFAEINNDGFRPSGGRSINL